MSSENRLDVEMRTQFGKGAARRVRRAGKVPAVVYGHGSDPIHITLPGHDAMMALKGANALLTLVIEGQEQLALAKDVQRNPIKPVIEHVDLVVVRRGEKVTVDVPVHTTGEAAPETVVTLEHSTLQVEVEATNIPENIEVSIEGLQAGAQVLAGAVALPAGASLAGDPEMLIVNVSAMISQEALEAELADADAGVPASDDEDGAAGSGDAATADAEDTEA